MKIECLSTNIVVFTAQKLRLAKKQKSGKIQPMNTQPNRSSQRLRLALLALAALILTPFGLYFALQSGRDGLAAVLFGLLSAGILLVMLTA